MVDTMILRRIQQDKAAKSDAQIHVSEEIVIRNGSIDEDDDRWCREDDGRPQIDRNGFDGLLEPEMAARGRDVHRRIAVVERMHCPERRDSVLRAVEKIFKKIDGDDVCESRWNDTKALRREDHQATAERAHHDCGPAQNEWRDNALDENGRA